MKMPYFVLFGSTILSIGIIIAGGYGYIGWIQKSKYAPTLNEKNLDAAYHDNPLGERILWDEFTPSEFSCNGRIALDFGDFVSKIGLEELKNPQHFHSDESGSPGSGMETVHYNSGTQEAFTGLAKTPHFYRKLLGMFSRPDKMNQGDDDIRRMIDIQDYGLARACISDRYYLLKASQILMGEGSSALYAYDRKIEKIYHIDASLQLNKIDENYHPSRIYYRDGLINMEGVITYVDHSGSIKIGHGEMIYGLKYQFDLSEGKLYGTDFAPERLRKHTP